MIRSIRTEFTAINVSDAAIAVLALAPYFAGWLAGYAVRLGLWLVAALVAGYKSGRGGTE